jgi:integrase/recombinase XerC
VGRPRGNASTSGSDHPRTCRPVPGQCTDAPGLRSLELATADKGLWSTAGRAPCETAGLQTPFERRVSRRVLAKGETACGGRARCTGSGRHRGCSAQVAQNAISVGNGWTCRQSPPTPIWTTTPIPFAVALRTWLQRTGRLYNPHEHTNTLGATDDYAALSAFLRERTCRSRHTWRAYTKELERLVTWCQAQDLGPLSDLTRQDLLKYKSHMQKMRPGGRSAGPEAPAPKASMSETSQARALAVVASLYRYWHETGYLQGNPTAGLTGGSRAQAGFAPTRMVSAELLALCDAWANRSLQSSQTADVNVVRRCAIWILFRFSGARLSELAWNPSEALPRIAYDKVGSITLTVVGKGNKIRQIPLPTICVRVLRRYRLARGLSEQPDALEQIPLIHGEKAGYLGARGLYDDVKAVLLAVASEIEQRDPQSGLLLRTVSPHWLRHAYARTLVVDKRVPLPAAQALLGHASVQTTAAYAKTDFAHLREFVEAGFGN